MPGRNTPLSIFYLSFFHFWLVANCVPVFRTLDTAAVLSDDGYTSE